MTYFFFNSLIMKIIIRDSGFQTLRREWSPTAAIRQEPLLVKFWVNEKLIFPAWSMAEILNYLAAGLTLSLLSSNETDPGVKTLHTECLQDLFSDLLIPD